MFALRFDPSQVVGRNVSKGPAPIIPVKRTKHDEEEDEADEDEDEEQEAKNEDEKQGSLIEERRHDVSNNNDESGATMRLSGTFSEAFQQETDSSYDEGENDERYVGLGEAFEATDDIELQDNENDDIAQGLVKNHSSVISRFQRSINYQSTINPALNEAMDDEEIPKDGSQYSLGYIPQPAVVRNSISQDQNEHKSVAWLNTTKIHYNNTMTKPFDSYSNELQPKLLANIKKYFANDTFPIQTVLMDNILPVLNFSLTTTKKHLTRRVGDILVNASTGSGKTLGYSIPVVQMLSKRTVNRLRCLIVLPTKLLINQVYDTISKLSQGTGLIITMSKIDYSMKEEHKKLLQNEPDILIITPGRLVDHLNMDSISLRNLNVLILDEADHLLNQSFQNWCSELMERLKTEKIDQMPGNVIKMVFSATLTTNTEKLHGLHLYKPKLFMMDSVKLYNLPAKLQEYNINIPTAKSVYKPLVLLHLINYKSSSKILVFVKSNEASLRLASLLNIMIEERLAADHHIASINSNNTKGANKKLVNEFAARQPLTSNCVLITTDLMSRGIDINDITDVINYDLPIGSQQYVHRCGRTARAQTQGNAYNLLVGKGERTFWSNTIDEDMSRDVDGFSPKNWDENDTEESDSENREHQERKIELTNVTSHEETVYRSCLEILKQKAHTR